MNGDDDDAKGRDLNTPVEILAATTLGCIEALRRKRVCLFPGPHRPLLGGDISDFGHCLPLLEDCNALIFCAPHQDKQTAVNTLQHYLGGGDHRVAFDADECAGIHSPLIWDDNLLFPRKGENLLVVPPRPNGQTLASKPPDKRFWAHYVILSIVGRAEKLHLLQLGLRGEDAWPYFLGPNGIQVARVIADPAW
jgi:hypothetical protein